MTIHGSRPQQNQDLPYPGKPEQLKLFMTGNEWKSYVTHSTDGPLDRVWPEKEAQARESADQRNAPHGAGVYESMHREGYVGKKSVNSPPTIVYETSPSGKQTRRVQSQGHHRVAAAAAVEDDSVVGQAAAAMLGGPADKNRPRTVYLTPNYIDTTPGARARQREDRARQEAREMGEL